MAILDEVKSKGTLQAAHSANPRCRVLVIDCDQTCLLMLENLLKLCNFEVTECGCAKEALSMFEEDRNRFDIIMTELHLPDMDGFDLLKHIGLYMDLPVIIMSANDGEDVIRAAFVNGASDYLVKPIQIEDVRYLWKHTYHMLRKNVSKGVAIKSMSSNNYEKGSGHSNTDPSLGSDGECSKPVKKRKAGELGEAVDDDDALTPAACRKKQRLIWTSDLHEKFLAAVNQLGIRKAVPEKILEIMNVPGITRENVGSHLQKHRQHQRRFKESIRLEIGGASCSLDRHDFQAETTISGQETVLEQSVMQQEARGGSGKLMADVNSGTISGFEMKQLAANFGELGSSDRQRVIRSTYELNPTAPFDHQPVLGNSITKYASGFSSSPTSSLGTISEADVYGAYYGHESRVGNDAYAASVFPAFIEIAAVDVVEGGIHEKNGDGIIVEATGHNNASYPVSVACPTTESELHVAELPWNVVPLDSVYESYADIEIASTCGRGQHISLNHGNQYNTFENASELSYDPAMLFESLNQDDFFFEQLEQECIGLVQQTSNLGGSSMDDLFFTRET
ncbi:hypothetical protein Nepgr_000707 [Nepenthes gracilis]|uniref:Uncharacterized protein n=1 Tax=Nepenthes gracilis TaxID=150966 RepID=A0AAD3P5R9_NEPGR|nr:hypothetical protein Nepgr_000707 [Nepenthes gracilis]